jgi:hypothetical protein
VVAVVVELLVTDEGGSGAFFFWWRRLHTSRAEQINAPPPGGGLVAPRGSPPRLSEVEPVVVRVVESRRRGVGAAWAIFIFVRGFIPT